MPAVPEVLEVSRGVRGVEVLREAIPEEVRAAERDVRVAREVRVDLERVRVDGHQHLDRRKPLGVVEHALHEVLREEVPDDDLLREARRDEPEALGMLGLVEARGARELGEHVLRAHDRARHQVGKKQIILISYNILIFKYKRILCVINSD